MTDAIRAAIEGASAYLSEHPDEARYTDSLATARLGGDLGVHVEGPGGELLRTDMPAAVGGVGAAPSPGWFMRAAVAACVASLAGMRAAQLEVTGFRCTVEVDSESDDRGILGLDASVSAGPQSMRISLHVGGNDVDPSRVESIATWAVDHCPVSDAVRRAVPLRVEVSVD